MLLALLSVLVTLALLALGVLYLASRPHVSEMFDELERAPTTTLLKLGGLALALGSGVVCLILLAAGVTVQESTAMLLMGLVGSLLTAGEVAFWNKRRTWSPPLPDADPTAVPSAPAPLPAPGAPPAGQ